MVRPDDPGFDEALAGFGEAGASRRSYVRSVIVVQVARVSDSCGYGVPRLEFAGARDQLTLWAERKGEDGLRKYVDANNLTSIDGLPPARSRA